MTSVNNSVGAIEFGPALARGGSTQAILRALSELATSAGSGAVTTEWRDTAIVAMLGQLAVTDRTAIQTILRGVCTVARLQKSLDGLLAVFLSALLGVSDDDPEVETAINTWTVLGPPAATGADLVPVLNPQVRDLCYLSHADIGSLTAFDLRAQVAALCGSRSVSPGGTEDRLAFGVHLVTAALAVASAYLLRARPDSSPYLAPSVAVIPPTDRSEGLPQLLIRGTALLVQVCLVRGVSPAAAPGGAWRSLWPTTPLLPAAIEHPYWTVAKLCPAWPMNGPLISSLLIVRDSTLVLPPLPRFDATGKMIDHGCYPDLTDAGGGETDIVDPGRGWRLNGPATTDSHLPDAIINISGLYTDPLTGLTVDIHGHPVGQPPSVAFGDVGSNAAVRDRLTVAARAAGLSSVAKVGDVIDVIKTADYGPNTG